MLPLILPTLTTGSSEDSDFHFTLSLQRRAMLSLEMEGLAPGSTVQTSLHAGTCDQPSASFAAMPELTADENGVASASGPVAPAGSADLVLFLRNLHDWMAAGVAEKAFADAYGFTDVDGRLPAGPLHERPKSAGID